MIDLHQHPTHFDKTIEDILRHTEALGARMSVVLPVNREEKACICTSEVCRDAAREHPERLTWFCVARSEDPGALGRIERYAKEGAKGFGEHKVELACDDPRSVEIYRLCGRLGLPVLIHFEDANYNTGFERFENVLEKLPGTTFIGHAQTWWANLSAADRSRSDYPKEKVVPGGLTDRWLARYPNLYADLSAGSGLNACERDIEFYRGFLKRHRRKLLFATDCPCRDGQGGGWEQKTCFGRRMLPHLRELCESDEAYEDITERNLARLLRIPTS